MIKYYKIFLIFNFENSLFFLNKIRPSLIKEPGMCKNSISTVKHKLIFVSLKCFIRSTKASKIASLIPDNQHLDLKKVILEPKFGIRTHLANTIPDKFGKLEDAIEGTELLAIAFGLSNYNSVKFVYTDKILNNDERYPESRRKEVRRHLIAHLDDIQFLLEENDDNFVEELSKKKTKLRTLSLIPGLRNIFLQEDSDWIANILNNQESAEQIMKKKTIGELLTVIAIDRIISIPEEYKGFANSCVSILDEAMGSPLTKDEIARIKKMIMTHNYPISKEEKLNQVGNVGVWTVNTIRNFIKIREHAMKYKDKIWYMCDWNIPDCKLSNKIFVDPGILKVIDVCFKDSLDEKISLEEFELKKIAFPAKKTNLTNLKKLLKIFDFSNTKIILIQKCTFTVSEIEPENRNDNFFVDSGLEILLEIIEASVNLESFTFSLTGMRGIPSMIFRLKEILSKFENLTTLVIKNNQLGAEYTGILIESLRSKKKIKLLDISGNSLRELRDWNMSEIIIFLKSIKVIDGIIEEFKVVGNNLNAFDLAEILIALRTRNTKILDISFNRIQSPNFFNSQHCDLKGKKCKHFSVALLYLGIIYPLHSSSIKCVKYLSNAFSGLKLLTTLRMAHNNLDASTVVMLVENIEKIENLDFSQNIADFSSRDLQKFVVSSKEHLKSLNMGSNFVDLKTLIVILENFKGLEFLSVYNNQIFEKYAKQDNSKKFNLLANSLAGTVNLRTLNLSENWVTSKIANIILNGLIGTNLESLDLSLNNIEMTDNKVQLESFEKFSNLKELDISKNKIGTEGIEALLGSLSNCQNLKNLNINKTGLKVKSQGQAERLFNKIGDLENLQKLDLSRSGIPVDLLNILVRNLKKVQKIEELNLEDSLVGLGSVPETAKFLGEFRDLKTLQSLNFAWNSFFRKIEINDLLNHLKNVKSLKKLDISSIKFELKDRDQADEFFRILSDFKNLEDFDFSNNRINSVFLPKIISGLFNLKKRFTRKDYWASDI